MTELEGSASCESPLGLSLRDSALAKAGGRPLSITDIRIITTETGLADIISLLDPARPSTPPAVIPPEGVCPVIYAFVRGLLRIESDRREQLWPFVVRLAASKSSSREEQRRAFLCADWVTRELAPLVLDRDFPDQARALRELESIADQISPEESLRAARSAHDLALLASTSASAEDCVVFAISAARTLIPEQVAAAAAEAAAEAIWFYQFAKATGADAKILSQMQFELLDRLCSKIEPEGAAIESKND